MIICHCNAITDHDIRAAIDWMRAADAQTIITPGKVYRALGKRPNCGGCLPVFLKTLQGCDGLGVPMKLHDLRGATTQGKANEGRYQSHRIPQQRVAE